MERFGVILFLILMTISVLTLTGGIFYIILQYRKKRIAFEAERKLAEEIHKHELLKTKVESKTQTMKFIGLEIHDSVTQKLTLASIYLNMVKAELNDTNLTQSGKLIQDSLDELRQLSHTLIDDKIERLSLGDLIKNEAAKLEELDLIKVELDIEEIKAEVNVEAKNMLIRVVQEFIQNTLKHAHASKINIHLSSNAQNILLHLSDDGIGFDLDAKKSEGMGLSNIFRRVHALQGIAFFDNTTAKGTLLKITIPKDQIDGKANH